LLIGGIAGTVRASHGMRSSAPAEGRCTPTPCQIYTIPFAYLVLATWRRRASCVLQEHRVVQCTWSGERCSIAWQTSFASGEIMSHSSGGNFSCLDHPPVRPRHYVAAARVCVAAVAHR
jgi:hypothetical protein